MKRPKLRFSIVDFLILTALVMIAVGIFAPHFARARAKVNPSARPAATATVRPAIPAR